MSKRYCAPPLQSARSRGATLRAQLENAITVRVKPELRYQYAAEHLRLELRLEYEDRPEHGKVIEGTIPAGACSAEEVSLLLREQFAIGPTPSRTVSRTFFVDP